MESSIKLRLTLYMFLSGISYAYLIMTPWPGISVPVFILIQFAAIYFIVRDREEVKNKKGILMMIPIFIISLNYFISNSYMFYFFNYIAIVFLYSAMIVIMNGGLSIKKDGFGFIFNILGNVFMPLTRFKIPFRWYTEGRKSSRFDRQKVMRVLMGIGISVPAVVFLIAILSSADMVFSEKMDSFLDGFTKIMDYILLYKIFWGAVTGLYLFGGFYGVFLRRDSTVEDSSLLMEAEKLLKVDLTAKPLGGDLLVVNMLLTSILMVYTLFIGIQFKYLFAGAELPGLLNYAEYARRGFFELVFLSVVNVGLILFTVFINKRRIYEETTVWSKITKIFLIYLCGVTMVLLISSFYRMMLYDGEYGFTRLRVMVYLFLIFEAAGLLFTVKYVLRPRFNIVMTYCIIGLVYYMMLNVIQIDYWIAKRNVDMYFESEKKDIDIEYLMRLSYDAAPQIKRLAEDENVDFVTGFKAREYIEGFKDYKEQADKGWYGNYWQSYNLSIEKAKKIQ